MAKFVFWEKWRTRLAQAKEQQAQKEVHDREDASMRARNLPEIQTMMLRFEIVFAERFEFFMRQMLSEHRLAQIGRTLAGRREVPFADQNVIRQLLECGRVWGETNSPERDADGALAEFVATGHGEIVCMADLSPATRTLAVEAALASPDAYDKIATPLIEREATTADRVRRAIESLVPTFDFRSLNP